MARPQYPSKLTCRPIDNTKIEFIKYSFSHFDELSKALQTVLKAIECNNKWKVRALNKDALYTTESPVNFKTARLCSFERLKVNCSVT